MSLKSQPIVIVGAGVIGLSAALVLKQQGYSDVTIVAEYLPESGGNSPYYTSTKAGAHFRPFPSHNISDVRESEYTRHTYRFLKELSAKHPESSVRFVRGYDWIDDPSPLYTSLQKHYTKQMPNFDVLDTKGLPKGITFACGYDTWVVNAPLYVSFLYRRLAFHYGVKFIQRKLASLEEAYTIVPGTAAAVINATATGLQYDGSLDPACFPIRGQTLLLRVPPTCPYLHKTITHQNVASGEWTFVIPRPLDGGLILGGTKQIGSTVADVIDADVEALATRALKYFPEVFVGTKSTQGSQPVSAGLDIAKVNVGFRPARRGGSRVEAERVNKGQGSGRVIVHAYGIGGMGFEASYGMALHVVELLEGGHSGLQPKL
ncbi:uncharacterized protein SAPINGB_P000737 [Magnusiomyces paraingens]|uniref:FAD dependent oxidoreductase domain-containing protein n=1 Tax=Magnusiomyces paraingens TaxID=2606893 RepID=A0A5E8B2G5_9ASCO|nr:uncharacterized protein SAPINGB_P000737 [Saprochaete ingens]VVT45399.1 unnamed protein product [Saprochaete ingens]